MFEQVCRYLSREMQELREVLYAVSQCDYALAKLKIAKLNGLTLGRNSTYDFFGDEYSRIIKFLSVVHKFLETSVCSSSYCPVKEIVRTSYDQLTLSKYVRTEQEFVSSVHAWLYASDTVPCMRTLQEPLPPNEGIVLVANNEE